jgi:hypothetical protein
MCLCHFYYYLTSILLAPYVCWTPTTSTPYTPYHFLSYDLHMTFHVYRNCSSPSSWFTVFLDIKGQQNYELVHHHQESFLCRTVWAQFSSCMLPQKLQNEAWVHSSTAPVRKSRSSAHTAVTYTPHSAPAGVQAAQTLTHTTGLFVHASLVCYHWWKPCTYIFICIVHSRWSWAALPMVRA